jgi:adenosylcobinamide-phosphate synthase
VHLEASTVLLVAIAVEVLVGDPESRWHPVALFGRVVAWLMERAPDVYGPGQLAYGALAVAVSVAGVAALSAMALRTIDGAAPMAAVFVGGFLLKASFSYRQLEREATRVAGEIDAGRLVGARTALRALVSRETADLSEGQAASAAVESLAENLCDSVVAPLCFFLLWGVPGALAYRAINTWDAMAGYHGRYEYLGRAAARLDDLANLIPARLTTGLLVIAASVARADAFQAIATVIRDHGRTESPNAGWPMAAMAGALGVRLEKAGHYCLGERFPLCDASDVRRSVRISRIATALAALLALGVTLFFSASGL